MTESIDKFLPITITEKDNIQYFSQTELSYLLKWCRDELNFRAQSKGSNLETEITKELQSENNDLTSLVKKVNRVRQDMNAAQLRIECSEKCTLGAVNDNVYVAFEK